MEMRNHIVEAAPGGPSDLGQRNRQLADRITELTATMQHDHAVTQLSAGIAHDLLNSLQVLLGEADELSAKLEDPPAQESMQVILEAGQHTAALCRDLLDLARAKQGGAALVNTAELVASCQRLIERVTRKQVRCVFCVEPEVWPVEVEPQKLESALINLSANARDAMPEGGLLRIVVHNVPRGTPLPPGLPQGEYVAFSVEDTGVGMSPQVLAQATEAFFTTKAPGSGTGLGLSMVRALAVRAGGTVHIESEQGRGTRVHILLPRAPSQFEGRSHLPASVRAVYERVRTAWFRELLDAWLELCPEDGFPRTFDLEAATLPYADHAMLIALEPGTNPAAFRLISMGDALAEMLGRALIRDDGMRGVESLTRLQDAYRHALDSHFPTYEYARYGFGEGPTAEFERLILPAAFDGKTLSHLIGVAVLTDV